MANGRFSFAGRVVKKALKGIGTLIPTYEMCDANRLLHASSGCFSLSG